MRQPNEHKREIKKKTRGAKQKSGGGHDPLRPLFRIATGPTIKMLPLPTPHIRLEQYKMRENHVSCLLQYNNME